jgi:aryl-alcohol dehydrogenase-like predicted oxidoreductase
MEFRRLGRSGLKVSEISYGNWLTHGSQVEADQATACVREALEVGITTFDTADVYAQTKAETVLGDALKGQRREGLEIFTKVYWPTGPGPNDRGLSRKHITESLHGSLRRLQTDYVDLYQAHRFDHETPLEETLRAFDDLVRQGKVLYIGVSEIVWSPIAQGVLTGKYLPGQAPPEGSRATDPTGSGFIKGFLRDTVLEKVQQLRPLADEAGLSMAALAVAWVLQNDNVASAIIGASRPEQVRDNVAAAGVRLDDALLRKVDDVLEGVVVSDPAKTVSPPQRP